MSQALVLTVGTGTRADSDIVEPLKKTIRNSNPRRVVFLVSRDSTGHAETIRAELALELAETRIVDVGEPDDVERTFRCALGAFRDLRSDGFAAEDVDADYTSGTKAMTAGLTLAAVAFGCGSLKYIAGMRELGVVVAGTERFLCIPPAGILGHQEVQIADRLFRALQFEAVRQVLPERQVRLLDAYDARILGALHHLAVAYDAWDKFQHAGFAGPYSQIPRDDFALVELAPFAVPEGVAERLTQMGAPDQDDLKKRFTADRLADLWNNARRRMREGKYDDAVARLYRLGEMVAQFTLANDYDVNTSNVRLGKLPSLSNELTQHLERQRQSARGTSDRESGNIKIGLQDDYRLLAGLDSRVGKAFEQLGNVDQLLSGRNRSILGHGLTPIGKETADALGEAVRTLAGAAVSDFERRCAELQFPWLERD